ncbi:MAG: hypothetical protein ACO29V_10455 [Limnohabitans sp.]
MNPGTYNIRPQRRADFQLNLTFKTSEGVPIDLSDFTVLAQVWDKCRTTKYGDFTVDTADEVDGNVILTLGYAITEVLPDEAYYDVMLIDDSSGLRSYYLEGIVRPSEGYTEPEAP